MKGIVAILCSLIGYLIARYIPDGPLAVYAPLIISYHLILLFVAITTSQEKGVSLPIATTALYHVAFVAVLIVSVQAREMIPYFSIVRFFIPNLALAEAAMLFSGKGAKKAQDPSTIFIRDAASNSTAEDYEEFIVYMRQSHRPFARAGQSVRDEFNSWLAHRAKHPAVVNAGQRPAA